MLQSNNLRYVSNRAKMFARFTTVNPNLGLTIRRDFFLSNIKPFFHANKRNALSTTSLLNATRHYSSSPSQEAKETKPTAQERANRIIYHVKAGSKLLLSSWLIVIAAGATLVTSYLVATEIFSPSGETSTFNRVVNMIEKDESCLRLLGYTDTEIEQGGIRLKAYGGMSPDLWTRNIPVQATKFTGKDQKEHMTMRFFVESNKTVGVVNLEAIEENFINQELVFVSVDVRGKNRHYLIGGAHVSHAQRNLNPFSSNGFLGVKWGSKKD